MCTTLIDCLIVAVAISFFHDRRSIAEASVNDTFEVVTAKPLFLAYALYSRNVNRGPPSTILKNKKSNDPDRSIDDVSTKEGRKFKIKKEYVNEGRINKALYILPIQYTLVRRF